jgi:hypothetical protein
VTTHARVATSVPRSSPSEATGGLEQWRAQAGGEQQRILSSPRTDGEIIEIDNLPVWGGTAMEERALSDLAWT